jgi:peptidoglycan/LPS O-acetylase OafA/YrhL
MEKNIQFKINNFDLLRLIAATEVIFDHSIHHLHIPASNLGYHILYLFPGVKMFFVISGYLISASFERNNSLRDYFRNRALRIFPGLWACVIVTIIVISITGVSFFNKQVIAWLPSQFVALIYTPQFLSHYGFGSYNGSLWTIPIELQFYLLLPLIYLSVPKKHLNRVFFALLIIFAGLSCGYQLMHASYLVLKLIRYSFIPHLYVFLIGVLLQRLHLYKSRFIYKKGLYWLIGYIAVNLILVDRINPVVFEFLYTFLLAFCVLSMAYTLPNTAKILLRTNDISYGIYIYHGLILTVMIQEKFATPVYLVVILSYIAGFLSWIFVEKPFIRMKKKTIRATLNSPSPVASANLSLE